MLWSAAAAALLDAAAGAKLSAPPARVVVAPGPGFARDCRMLAVVFEGAEAVTAGLPGLLGGAGCAVIPVATFRVFLIADCVPAANDKGRPPPADAVTAWTSTFLADAEAVWFAVLDASFPVLGPDAEVTTGAGSVVGPGGGVAQFSFPVRVSSP